MASLEQLLTTDSRYMIMLLRLCCYYYCRLHLYSELLHQVVGGDELSAQRPDAVGEHKRMFIWA